MTCNTCKSCDEVTTALTDFSCTATDTLIEQELRAQFLNQRFGFALDVEQYNTFLSGGSCGSGDLLCPTSPFGKVQADTTCYASLIYQAELNAQLAYEALLDSIRADFIETYLAACRSNITENFELVGDLQEYHITLYYHDQANNLVKTIPPNGVQPLTVAEINQSVEFRKSGIGSPVYPPHTFETRYLYNSLDEVIIQDSPDADSTRFWYDEVGRLVASQDGRQRPLDLYSYTLRDELGRTIEVGEITQSAAMTDAISRSESSFDNWINGGTRRQVTQTIYDAIETPIVIDGETFIQENLRPRVARVTLNESGTGSYDYATHYSYDITGNVKTIIQEIAKLGQFGQRFKRIDYEYDYISGNVHKVYYQRDKQDQFTYRYEYDANNRLIVCYTSLIETENNDSPFWTTDGTNEYYLHGLMARMEIGEQRVQGVDYAYTLQGWMKGVNSSLLDAQRDMGGDGQSALGAAKDALAFTIGYYEDDYQQIAGNNIELNYSGTSFGNASSSLYNGNIRHVALDIKGLNSIGYTYQYDQLHRLKSMRPYNEINTSNYAWQTTSDVELDYQVSLGYDPNGNIMRLTRRGNASKVMDNLFYKYQAGTNQLLYIDDFSAAGDFDDDIDDQNPSNYAYDGAGNMMQDFGSGITQMNWSVYGKVLEVKEGQDDGVLFGYDAMQNRVYKASERDTDIEKATYYIRDAQGNVLGIYEEDNSNNLAWVEQYLYGNSRIGVCKPQVLMSATPTDPFYTEKAKLYEGDRTFELTNHLGSVLATINDRRYAVDDNSDATADFYEAVVLNASDYFPFGLSMPGRNYTITSENIRFGYHGQERDTEWSNYNHTFRPYDERIGRMRAIDPLTTKYPSLSAYQFSSNNPIANVDLEGAESEWYMAEQAEKLMFGTSHLKEFRTGATERAIETVVGLAHAPQAILAVANLVNQELSAIGFEFCVTADCGRFDANNTQVMPAVIQAVAYAIYNDYKHLVVNAAEGDAEAIGALAFEAALFFVPGDEIRYLRGVASQYGKSIGKQSSRLFAKTRSEAARLVGTQSKSTRGPVVTGVLDTKSGEIFIGTNSREAVTNLHPILKERLQALNRRTGGAGNRPDYVNEIPGSHSEISALNDALWARERAGQRVTENQLSEFILHNRSLRNEKHINATVDRCPDCAEITDGVITIGNN